jgi:hypothetical protein
MASFYSHVSNQTDGIAKTTGIAGFSRFPCEQFKLAREYSPVSAVNIPTSLAFLISANQPTMGDDERLVSGLGETL